MHIACGEGSVGDIEYWAIKIFIHMFVQGKVVINMENTSVGQRFVQLISHLGISKNAFAVSLDKTATVIQHLVEERNKPGFDLLCKVFEVYPSVSKDWLLQGSGPMLNTGERLAQPDNAPVMVAKTTSEARTTRAAAPLLEPEPATPTEPTQPMAVPEPAAVKRPAVAPVPPVDMPPPVAAPSVAPAVAPEAAWQTALYTQQMAHQLAIAEMRNQHLQDQQRLMQQMMDLMQRKLM